MMDLLGYLNRKPVLLVLFLLAGFGFGQPALAYQLIDNFVNGGGDNSIGPGVTAWQNPNTGILGGEREAECHADSNNGGLSPILCSMNTFDSLILAINDNGDAGYFNVVWDGVDNVASTYENNLGLGGIDFTGGGDQNIVRMFFSSDNANETGSISLCAYTTLVDFSCKEIPQVPDTVQGLPGINTHVIDFLFSDFSDTVGGAGADFTNVNAFELLMSAQDAIILVVDHLSANNELDTNVNYELITDNNGDGDIDPDDVVEYTVTITNRDDLSDRTVTNISYSANIDANAALISGTVTADIDGLSIDGNITVGNGGSDTSVAVTVGSLDDASMATIKYQIQIDSAVPDKTAYTHAGSVTADNGINTTTTVINTSASKPGFTIGAFNFTNIMTAAAFDDADGDGYAGPGERVRFTSTTTNNSSVSNKFHWWQYDIDNASLGGLNFPVGFQNLSGSCTGCFKLNRSSWLTSGSSVDIKFNVTIDNNFPFTAFTSVPAYIEAQSIMTEQCKPANGSDYLVCKFFEFSDDDVDNETDPTRIRVDAFPSEIAASVDNDGDGLPDEWNIGCDATCQTDSGLTLDSNPNDTDNDGLTNDVDPDIDDDGVANGSDAFPYIFAASLDSDGDGMPDSWTVGCDATCQSNSGLTLDDDRDGDGVANDLDPFPDDGSVSVDTDGDGFADDWDDGCDTACQDASSQVLDTDDDDDGVLDVDDDFPLDESVALDTDADGLADDWVASCDAACQSASSQTLDDDDDGDGDLDVNDAYPANLYASLDDDFDGMPDAWNSSSGCNEAQPLEVDGCETLSGLTLDPYPNDTDNDGESNDVDTDIDGDGLLNGVDGDVYHDTNPPVVTAPADQTVKVKDSLGSTFGTFGSATAVDYLDGNLTATPDTTGPFPVGTYVITWSATDAAGNTGTDTQVLTVEVSSGGGGGGSLGFLSLLSMTMLILGRKRWCWN